MLAHYLDAAAERHARAFDERVEVVRVGSIIAASAKAAARFRALRQRQHLASTQAEGGGSVGLTGAALERAVLGLATAHPDLVAIRT